MAEPTSTNFFTEAAPSPTLTPLKRKQVDDSLPTPPSTDAGAKRSKSSEVASLMENARLDNLEMTFAFKCSQAKLESLQQKLDKAHAELETERLERIRLEESLRELQLQNQHTSMMQTLQVHHERDFQNQIARQEKEIRRLMDDVEWRKECLQKDEIRETRANLDPAHQEIEKLQDLLVGAREEVKRSTEVINMMTSFALIITSPVAHANNPQRIRDRINEALGPLEQRVQEKERERR